MPDVDRDDLDVSTRRAGWLDVLTRTDTLAVRCVRELLAWSSGDDLPFANTERMAENRGLSREWVARLEPASPRTARLKSSTTKTARRSSTQPPTPPSSATSTTS